MSGAVGGKPNLTHCTPAKLDISSGFATWWIKKALFIILTVCFFQKILRVSRVCQQCWQASGQPHRSVSMRSEPGPDSPPFQGACQKVGTDWEALLQHPEVAWCPRTSFKMFDGLLDGREVLILKAIRKNIFMFQHLWQTFFFFLF